jgi:hypothetical protein
MCGGVKAAQSQEKEIVDEYLEYAANLTRDIYKYYFGLEEEDAILTGTAVIPDAAATTAD